MTRVAAWLWVPTRRPLVKWALSIVVLLCAAVAFDVHERQVERHARTTAIAQAAKVGYQNQLSSCERGIGLRLQTRANALATKKVFHVLGGFLKGARPRAFAQSQDKNISAKSRAGAKHSLTSIDNGIAALSTPIAIPPVPTPCDQVITDPNAAQPPHHS